MRYAGEVWPRYLVWHPLDHISYRLVRPGAGGGVSAGAKLAIAEALGRVPAMLLDIRVTVRTSRPDTRSSRSVWPNSIGRMAVEEMHGVRVLTIPDEGPALGSGADALDLVAASYEHQADFIAIPVERLDPEFFTLSNGLAGEFLQKLVNYRLRVAVIDDLSARTEASNALRDFVRESNRRRQNWFLDTRAELRDRLAAEDISPEA